MFTPIYSAINKAFKDTYDLRGGELKDYSSSKIVCFTRTDADKTMLVIVNVTGSSQNFNIPAPLRNIEMNDIINNSRITTSSELTMKGYEYHIWVTN